jgi:hypothetical protein
MAKEKKSFKEKKDNLNKKVNKIWQYSTIFTILLFLIAGIYVGVQNTLDNKREMVLKSLVEYNKNTFGYDASEKPYSSAFPDCSYKYSSDFTDIKESMKDKCDEFKVYNYYDMIYIKITNYTEDIETLDSILTNESIAGWCVQNGVKYYYGSPDCPTADSGQWYHTEISSDSIETLASTLLNYISLGQTLLISDSNYGTFFVNNLLTSRLGSNIDSIDETNMYIIIAELMDSGWYTANAYDFMESYYTIKNNY